MAPGGVKQLWPPPGSKCTVLKKVFATLLELSSARGIVPPRYPPLGTPLLVCGAFCLRFMLWTRSDITSASLGVSKFIFSNCKINARSMLRAILLQRSQTRQHFYAVEIFVVGWSGKILPGVPNFSFFRAFFIATAAATSSSAIFSLFWKTSWSR